MSNPGVERIEELERKLYTDPLTGCYNRTKLEDIRSQIETSETSVIYTFYSIDANNLKMLNDKFGHETGDLLIRIVGTCCQKVWGQEASFHSGGDEFSVLILDKHQSDDEISDNIKLFKQLVDEYDAKYPDYPISAAIGAARGSSFQRSFKEVLDEADLRMMDDKAEYKRQHPEYDMRRARLTKDTLKQADEEGILNDVLKTYQTEKTEEFYKNNELMKNIKPILHKTTECAVKETIDYQDKELKKEVTNTLEGEMKSKLDNYRKRRKRKRFRGRLFLTAKVLAVILVLVLIIGNKPLVAKIKLVGTDIGDIFTGVFHGEDVTTNKLVHDIISNNDEIVDGFSFIKDEDD